MWGCNNAHHHYAILVHSASVEKHIVTHWCIKLGADAGTDYRQQWGGQANLRVF